MRSATIFKKALDVFMSKTGSWVGADLAKHPCFVLNKPGLDVLFAAITAVDTINNARKLLSDAEAKLPTLQKGANDLKKWTQSYDARVSLIKIVFTRSNSRNMDWTQDLQRIQSEGFPNTPWDVTEGEFQEAIAWANSMIEDMQTDLQVNTQLAERCFADFYALSSAAAHLVAAEKAYYERIQKLAGDSSTITSGFGKLEQGRKWNERTEDDLNGANGGGKTVAERVAAIMHNPELIVRDWRGLAVMSSWPDILLRHGSWVRLLPW